MIYSLSHNNVALLVIDVQQEYFKPAGPAAFESASTILVNVNRLIEGFRRAGKPVIFIKHMHREDGSDAGRMGDFGSPDDESSFVEGTPEVALHPDLDYKQGDVVVVKRRYSAFVGTDLEAVLRTSGTQAVVLCGMMTSFCCETTARDAHGRDYEVLFVSDAIAGPDLEDVDGEKVSHTDVMRSTTTALAAGFAEIVSSSAVLERLS
jgi:nicotinamidase-related amidase